MEEILDVMLIESHPGTGDRAVVELERAGHRVHRCNDAESDALCRGARDPDACPIAEGAQVALVAHGAASPDRAGAAQGVSCALRSRLPVVEVGDGLVDLMDQWVAARVGRDPVRTCVQAVRHSFDPLCAALWATTAEVIEEAGLDAAGLHWDVEMIDGGLHLVASGPALDARGRSRLAVRALDVVRADGRARASTVDISYVATCASTSAPDRRGEEPCRSR